MPKAKPELNALAEQLGCEVRTLRNWQKLDGAPSGLNVEAWLKFRDERGLGRQRGADLHALKVQIAEQDLERKRHENAVLRGESIPANEIRDFLREWAAKLDLLLTSELETNAPPLLDGKPIAEIRVTMRDVHDRIRAATARGLLSWEPEQSKLTKNG